MLWCRTSPPVLSILYGNSQVVGSLLSSRLWLVESLPSLYSLILSLSLIASFAALLSCLPISFGILDSLPSLQYSMPSSFLYHGLCLQNFGLVVVQHRSHRLS